jgi:antitoxin (DNA-binding transcriptional repressor) of toxin-antitoxin stability system
MTVSVNLPDAAENLADLIHQALLGEEVVIAEAGTPVVRLVPILQKTLTRIPGEDKGNVIIAADFNAPLPEGILNDFLNPTQPQP